MIGFTLIILNIYITLQKKNNTDISVCHFERMSEWDSKANTKVSLSANVYTPEDFYVKKNVNAVVAWGKLYKKNYGLI